jgi:hypothetical protein
MSLISISDALAVIRATKAVKKTTNNDFQMMNQSLLKSKKDNAFKESLLQS